MFKADLHVHTTFSDGTHTPKEVLEMAASKGLSGLAFTDHDNVLAFRQGQNVAQALGISLITGVELSSTILDKTVHILGYSFHPESMQKVIDQYESARKRRNAQILDRLSGYGMQITQSDLEMFSQSTGAIGRLHIAQVMLRKGFVRNIEEAFRSWIGDDQSCFVKADRYTAEETIQHIHDAGGLAVIAHPHIIRSKSMLEALLALPFDGIEANYSLFSEGKNAVWMEVANDKGWFCTGGSDFHGTIKPNVPLGCNYSGKGVFDILWKKFQQHEL